MQSKLFKCLPSEVIGIDREDTYTAYCFNEACLYIMVHLDNGEKPKYTEMRDFKMKPKNYHTFSEFYKSFNE